MTNGEKIKEVFPNVKISSDSPSVDICVNGIMMMRVDINWWNAEYKEPTTKNDKIDCKHTDCNNCVNHKYCDYETTSSEKPNRSEISTGSIVESKLKNPKTKNFDILHFVADNAGLSTFEAIEKRTIWECLSKSQDGFLIVRGCPKKAVTI